MKTTILIDAAYGVAAGLNYAVWLMTQKDAVAGFHDSPLNCIVGRTV